RPWHAAVWTLVAGLGVVSHSGWTMSPALAAGCGRTLALATIVFALLGMAQLPRGWRTAVTTDRKSTRLNSSHVKISYAVFCWHPAPRALPPFPTRRSSDLAPLARGGVDAGRRPRRREP